MQRWNTVTMGKVLDYMRFPHAYALFPRKDSRANRPAKARASRREAYQNLYEESLTFEERPTFRLTKLQLEREGGQGERKVLLLYFTNTVLSPLVRCRRQVPKDYHVNSVYRDHFRMKPQVVLPVK